jgi:hypothetical protein
MSIINDKERVEATNQISAIDIQESSGLLKDHISTSWLPDAVHTTTLTTRPQNANWITKHLAKPYSQPTIKVSVLEIDWLYVFDATIAKPYDSPMSEADGSKTRHVDINRHPLRQEAIKEGLDGQELPDCLWNPSSTLFLQGTFSPQGWFLVSWGF